MVFIYLDDLIVLGSTRLRVLRDVAQMVQDLLLAGFKINLKKSVLEPTQCVQHLGFILNLKEGLLEVPGPKLKSLRKDLGQILVKKHLSCRKMAAVLGSLRSLLLALPFLRAFTDQFVQFVGLQKSKGWDFQCQVPQSLKDQLKEVQGLLQSWDGRPFHSQATTTLHSDKTVQPGPGPVWICKVEGLFRNFGETRFTGTSIAKNWLLPYRR
jgi:hypothetical protein